MLRPTFQLGALLGAVALLLPAVGCQFPNFMRPDLPPQLMANQPPTATPAAKTVTATEAVAESPPTPPAADAMTAAADEATIAAVMQEVQEIGSTNPDAQQALLAELHRSKPSMWPLIVQQFRATLAYHDQLMSKPAAAPERPSDLDEQMSAVQVVHSPAPPTIGEPPSAAFGKLGDPRNSRPDPAIERLFATASPANMPAPTDAAVTAFAANAPQAFAADAAAQPIEGRAARNEERVVLASATTSEAPSTHRDVQPALYSVESTPTRAGDMREATAAAPDQRGWQQHLDLAIADLDRRLADGPNSTAEVHQLVSLRLLQLLAGRTEESLEPIPRISPKEQDYWSDQIFALATFLDHHTQPDDKRRAAASVTHLDDAVGHLRELGSLSLRNLAFCTKVYGYGSYEAIEKPRFAAGEQLSLYVEVENYHSESSEKGYATLLGASYELRDDAGRHVDSGEFPPVEDCCRSRRRDFHIQYGLVLPKTLKPGKYQFELAMKDRQSDKIGHASIDFEIRGL